MAKKAKKSTKKNTGESTEEGKKRLPRSFKLTLFGLVVIPLTIFLGWYLLTVVLKVSGSSQTAEGMVANQVVSAKDALKNKLMERANKEGFDVDNVFGCAQIEDQYRVPLGFVYTDFTTRQLVGLPKSATDAQVHERCIVFAKVVERMEEMSHHDRHVFVCEGAQFTTDEAGRYMLISDPKGRGVIEVIGGKKNLINMAPHSQALVKQWQVYNIGDGCVVVGMSKAGIFNFTGGVKLQ